MYLHRNYGLSLTHADAKQSLRNRVILTLYTWYLIVSPNHDAIQPASRLLYSDKAGPGPTLSLQFHYCPLTIASLDSARLLCLGSGDKIDHIAVNGHAPPQINRPTVRNQQEHQAARRTEETGRYHIPDWLVYACYFPTIGTPWRASSNTPHASSPEACSIILSSRKAIVVLEPSSYQHPMLWDPIDWVR
ncbi:hypothetical protein BD289DRAFT_50249 [Coniella lustricola]|uniref:Uncharacterized protein n=1 Tax=Coniella lustricola TaxID=2025994 RepID=A0A2T3A1A4_9PEZI|nr:hypothetical protein BD289DRAFT_50249 [Coniella lustricola]